MHHRICSRHFVDGSPTPENPYPTLFAYNNYKEPLQNRSSTSITKRSAAEKRNEFLEDSHLMESNEKAADFQSYNDSHSQFYMEMECVDFQTPPVVSEETVASACETLNTVVQPCQPDHEYASAAVGESHGPDTVDSGIQTDIGMEEMEELMALKKKFENPDALMRNLFIEKVTATDRSVKQYTGIPSKSMLHGMYEVLDEASPNIKYWSGQSSAEETPYQQNADRRKTGPTRKLSKYEEFIMTLIRLRLAIFTFFLADIFGVSNTRVSQIFTTWVNFMYHILTPLLVWPSTPVIKKFLPKSFKLTFPNTVCIIDCTEFFIQKPRSPSAQSRTYSTYKHHNTYKALIGIMPSGAIIFISDLWGGNTSDRYITKNCGFLDFVRPGHEIMADRGFLIRDLLLERHAKLVIPPFTKKCNWGKGKRLLQNDIIKTRCIARLRIHVERAIERLKNFNILSNTMPLSLKPLSNQILKVCAFLCNLQTPLVKK
ncbi:uncharacterized protein LOC134230395 isoform X1 [Saccostrea cucullata]|uniref:uncharacterized protein LOC134230395 isoform X1 n=2 Tax=Saccostrea cuccullata TaxID=36930 RepID=UPI002ED67611